jgi:5-methylcytosine-specific restriction endonuclease McrA
MGRPTGSGKRRIMLWRLQGQRCAACGGWLHPNISKGPQSPTIDEVIPRSKGGMRVLGNQVVMHKRCNEAKADRMPNGCELIWLELVGAKLKAKGKIG